MKIKNILVGLPIVISTIVALCIFTAATTPNRYGTNITKPGRLSTGTEVWMPVTTSTAIEKGSLVKLASSYVSPCAAGDATPFGVALTGCDANATADQEHVLVDTSRNSIIFLPVIPYASTYVTTQLIGMPLNIQSATLAEVTTAYGSKNGALMCVDVQMPNANEGDQWNVIGNEGSTAAGVMVKIATPVGWCVVADNH